MEGEVSMEAGRSVVSGGRRVGSGVGSAAAAATVRVETLLSVSGREKLIPVSYTHLTLPTIYSV